MSEITAFFRFTLVETLREPFFRFFVLFFLIIVALAYYFSLFSAVAQRQSYTIAYLALSYYAISFFTLFYPTMKISADVRKRMMYLFRSKPIRMRSYVLGKYGAYLFFVVALSLLAFLLSFTTDAQALPAAGYYGAVILEQLITLAAALFFGILFSPFVAFVFAFMFFFISHSTYEFLMLAKRSESELFVAVAKFFYALFPTYDFYDLSSLVIYKILPQVPVWNLALYSLVYTAFFLLSASIILEKRELS